MLLATQCPQCHTTFKVAGDQLKLQTGLVRCGVCQHVFNGATHLITPDPNAGENSIPVVNKPAVETTAGHSNATHHQLTTSDHPALPEKNILATPAGGLTTDNAFFNSFPETHIDTDLQIKIDAHQSALSETYSATTPFPELIFSDAEASETKAPDLISVHTPIDSPNLTSDLSPLELDLTSLADAATATVSTVQSDGVLYEPPHPTTDTSDKNTDPDNIEQLSFIRKANTKKRLARLLVLGTLILSLLFAGQVAYIFRDFIAASWPAGKKVLVSLCQFAHCQIQLPAQLDALSYEANELHSLPRPNTFEFSLLLHNHSPLTQEWPHIELTLKNAHSNASKSTENQHSLRRVFTPAEYLTDLHDVAAGFSANQEQPVKLYFEVSPFKASDYVVTIFYP